MSDTLNGARNGGPSWKWLAGVAGAILLTVVGSLLSWVAITVQHLSVDVAQLSMEVKSVEAQVSALNSRFDKQDAHIDQVNSRLESTINTVDYHDLWISAHASADNAIREAEQAKHPHRK